ncbi:MAG TPA: hypothetical protein VEU33_29250 [Archangium sp.]|nr:hypothetical protein [Archangium sp.]
MFGFLRGHHPNLMLGKRVLVTRAEDVNEVLKTDEAFGVTELYAERMQRTTGAFFLGMENTRMLVIASTLSAMFDPGGDAAPGRVPGGPSTPRATCTSAGACTRATGSASTTSSCPRCSGACCGCATCGARGGEGRMRFEGPFPDRLVVEFDPG